MTATVTLLTDRDHVVQQWRQALSKHDIESRVLPPGDLAKAVGGQLAIIVDVDGAGLDADELISTIGFVRASGALPIAHIDRDRDALEDIITDLCQGLVAQDGQDVAQVVSVLARRGDDRRHLRFEFVSVSPCSDDVLVVLGNGDASLHSRPIDASDDGSEITSITIDPSATKATLLLKSGAVCQLTVASLHGPSDAANWQGDVAIDGERLGARLRELRLAAGLTQAELARRTGIHRPNIARVEAGRHTPSLETLARIANAIGVSTTHVLLSSES
ncbi:MAG: helix-turn-helix domain-containing protein [Polyangiales bacterium]